MQLEHELSEAKTLATNEIQAFDSLWAHSRICCSPGYVYCLRLYISFPLLVRDCLLSTWIMNIQGVPLATEPGISLIILTPMKILQRNLNRSTFVVWEMKRNMSVVCVSSGSYCCDTEQRSPSQPGSVASGKRCIFKFQISQKLLKCSGWQSLYKCITVKPA